MYDLIIKNANIVDGTLQKPFVSDVAISNDLAKIDNDPYLHKKVGFLTPIAKVFCTDMGCRVTDLCIQIHGLMFS